MTLTQYYSLKKSLRTEYFSLTNWNDNFDIIDTTLNNKINKSIFVTANDFIVGTGVGTYTKKTLAETKTLLGVDQSTATSTGVMALATSAETTAGVVGNKAVTPSTLAVELAKKPNLSLITAANDFLVGSAASAVVKKTLAETKTILGVNAATSAGTGVVQLATQAEVTTGTDSAKAVTPATLAVYVLAKIAALISSSPSTLDTLNELATALGNDPNFATTITTLIGTKVAKADFTALNDILVGTGAGTYTKKTPTEVRTILNIADGANNYIHPSTHGQSIILDDLNHILERTIQVKAVTISSTIPNTLAAIDGYIPAAGDLILLASSGGHINDGVYTVAASGTTWTRASAHNTEALIVDRLIKVLNGTIYKNSYFTCVNRGAITIGTTAIKMQQVYGDRTGAGLSMDNKGALRVSVQGIISEMLANNLVLPGVPTAVTASIGTDTTQLATCAFVNDMVGGNIAPAKSLAADGYVKLANGLILQWGATSGTSDTFPIAFTTWRNIFLGNTYSNTDNATNINTYSLTGLTFSKTSGTTFWLAIGQ